MDEDTKCSFLKRAFPPGLEDEVTSIETKIARTAGPSDDLDDNKKRWLTVGICLHTVITPVLREYILPILIKLYYRLTIKCQIEKQTYPFQLKTDLSGIYLNYKTINMNKDIFGKRTNLYDYRVQNPVDLSKLFLQTHMAKYQAIDDSCDSSALLGIIININEFPVTVQNNSNTVRSNIRNTWAHCNFSEWNYGINLFKGTTLGLELVNEICQQTGVLAKYAKSLKNYIQNEMEKKAAVDNMLKDEIRMLKEEIKDIGRHQEEIIPKHIRDRHEEKIRDWDRDDETFVETRATERVMSWLSKCNIAVVTGSSGTGKSFLIHHVALELHRQKNYDIIPLSFLMAPSDIMNYYSKNRKQVFVIDDICGKGTMDVQLVNTWENFTEELNGIFKSNSTDKEETIGAKLLISCRLSVFNELQFKSLTLFTKNAFDLLAERLCLLPEERIVMIKKYIKSDNIDDVVDHICDFDFFPLLCKMSKNIAHENLKLFFTSPIGTIKQNIKHIIVSKNKHQLCAFVLCILFEEGFEEEWLNCRLNVGPKMLINKLKEITTHFDVDLDKELVRLSLKNGFSTLVGTFLKKIGTTYSLIHDKIYDIASIVCGQYLKECFIRNANGRFIGNKYIFEFIKTNPNDDFIVLSKEMEVEYFERLVDDLKQGDIYSTLHNKQLVHESFRKMLIEYLNSNAEGVHDLFREIDKNGIKLVTGERHCDWDDFYDTDDDDEITDDEVTNVTYPLIEAATEGFVDIVEFLIKMDCKVNKIDSFNRSALYKACEGGYQDIVEILLNHDADASLCHENESSPLHMACKAGNAHIVKLLLAKNVDVCKLDRDDTSPLREACKNGNVNIVKLLLPNDTNINVSDTWMEFCPLHLACEAGNLDVAKLLLEKNADVNSVSRFDDTPLSLACDGGYADIVKQLLENKTAADVCGLKPNKSPLYLACKSGKAAIVKMLLDNTDIYPKINTCDEIYSPLEVACLNNHFNVIQLLVQKCIDKFSSFDKCRSMGTAAVNGCTDIVKLFMENTMFSSVEEIDFALYLACTGGNLGTAQFLLTQGFDICQFRYDGRSLLHATCENFPESEDRISIINLLIQNQLDISKPDEYGLSPLHLACENGLLSICKLLISNKAKVNMQDNENRSPLHLACQNKKSDIVEVLLETGANVKLCDNGGKTPLHVICERYKRSFHFRPKIKKSLPMFVFEMSTKCKSITKSLIDHNAEVNARDNEGETPLLLACRYGDYELVKTILSSRKSDLNLQNSKGQTPLYLACEFGDDNIVEILLGGNADSSKEDNDGKSPLHVSLEILKSIKYERKFLKDRDDIDDLNTKWNIFEHIASLLIEYNTDMSKS
ncbi:uncharacterized protein LOC127719286 isoform X2 [Mytilus californianus]|uniref:uncharacterized protein LOC127719286 isoform X2 n=1 Tax=Mytilus californianus TaxID=6549 RepID=UPI002245D2D5|nr:uncharacterized protein LOC127719286 isoform X2 [Mytilus californianus]